MWNSFLRRSGSTLARNRLTSDLPEAGRASNENDRYSDTSWRKAGSLFVGADTLLGSVYLAVGHTIDGSSAVYLYWGRPR